MFKSYIILGSNLGNKDKNLEEAILKLKQKKCEIVQQSSLYESEAWGYSDEKTYVNQAVGIATGYNPHELLEICLNIENELGRKRSGNKYEARIIDIDVIFYENLVIHTNNLQIPHPRMHLRNFVLIPLAEICADFMHPVLQKDVAQLLLECNDKGKVTKKPL